MAVVARFRRLLSPNEIIRYAGLCIALLSSVLMLFVFKRTLDDAATAFLLSAFGTSGFAIFACLGFSKPWFQRLARTKSAYEQAIATRFLCACSGAGAVFFALLWWFLGSPPAEISTIGGMCWIAAYGLAAGIQSVRDIAYLASLGPAFERGEFVRRVGALLAICLVFVDKTCLLSGLVFLSSSLFSGLLIAHLLLTSSGGQENVQPVPKLNEMLRQHWREALKFQLYSGCELAFYAGPYFVLNAVGAHDSVLLYAYFQRLFQGITTFTRVPVDIGVYGVLELARHEFGIAARALVLRSALIAALILVVLALLWEPVSVIVIRQKAPWEIFTAVAIWVAVNCVLHFYGTYINLRGDFFLSMTKISLAMSVFLLLAVWGGEIWKSGIGMSLLVSGIAYGVMAMVLRYFAYDRVMADTWGHS